MLDKFLKTLPADPSSKVSLAKLYKAFKQTPKVEWSKTRFLSELGRAGVRVEKIGGKQCLIGYALPSDSTSGPATLQVAKRQRIEPLMLCAKCGGPVHPCYWLGSAAGSRCENCEADTYHRYKMPGARNKWTGMRGAYGDNKPKRKQNHAA